MPAAAGKVKGVVEIEAKVDRFTQPMDTVKRKLGEVEQKAKTSYQEMGAAADSATNRIAAGSRKASTAVSGLGNASAAATPKIKMTAEAVNNARIATIGATAGFVGMGAGVIGLSASLVNIPKRITDVQKTILDLSKTNLALDRERANAARMEMEIAKAREEGTKSVEELTRMEQERVFVLRNMDDVANDLIIKEEELKQKQDELNHAWLLTGSAVAMTAISGGSAILLMLSSMATQVGKTTGQFVGMKIAVITNSNALKLLMPNIAAARYQLTAMRGTLLLTGGAFTATGAKMSLMNISLKTLGYGFKALYLAIGPVGWVITALTVTIEAFEHNLGGFRDALSWISGTELPSLTEALYGATKKSDMLRDSMSLLQAEFDLTSYQMLELRGVIQEYNKDLDKQIEKEKAADLEKLRTELGLTKTEWEDVIGRAKEYKEANDAAGQSTDELSGSMQALGGSLNSVAGSATAVATNTAMMATAMSGGTVAATGMHGAIKSMYADLEGVSSLQLDVDMTMLTDSLEHVGANFEAYTADWNLAFDGMRPHILAARDTFNTAWGQGAFIKHIAELKEYGRISEEVFSEINAMIAETGTSMDKLGQKKTTLETDLRGLEGTERMLAHLENMRLREVKGQNFWRDNVVNGGGDSIQQAKNYYNSYVANKGQNQLDMGNWSSVDSGKPGFSPAKWVQNQGSNLEYRRRKEARERMLARSVGIAEGLGWEYRRRYDRENIVHYFRGKQSRAHAYVNEVKRRSAAFGVDPSRAAYERFDREVESFTQSTGLDSGTVREWRYTAQGFKNLVDITAFNERALLEEAAA